MASVLRRWLPLTLILAAAVWVRTDRLALRPMHADEANQAVKFGGLLEHGRYAFDAQEHHGPTLYYFALLPAWLRGETTLAGLTETTVRMTVAWIGVAAVLLAAGCAAPLGRLASGVAAGLLALSPPAVYYSRYFIQETLLAAFTLGALVCAARWWRTRQDRWSLAAGVCVGLMQATKASAPVFVLAAGLAALALRPAGSREGVGRAVAVAVAAAAAMVVLFYTSFGTNPAGLGDAWATYGVMIPRATGGGGHDKPWSYYLELFLFRREGGLVWDQTPLLVLALAGAVVAFRGPSGTGRWVLRFAVVYTGLVALVLSATPYKTPWLVVHLVPGLAVLAAGAVAALADRPRWGKAAAFVLVAAVAASQAWQMRQAVFLRPADARNPYAYAHTSPDAARIRPMVATLPPAAVVKVIGEEYWPLPWYLRGHARTGYWNSPPEDCDGALVVSSPALAGEVRSRLRGRYREDFLGLRPGVTMVMFMAVPGE